MANQPQQPDTALHNASHLMQYHDLIESIVAALDARDAYTASHSDRVADMVLVLAAALGLDEDETTRIHMAAHLHDIGKIAVPDSVLRKAGPLTRPEWEEMRRHPVTGYEILRKIDDFKEIAILVRHHHERWDGRGYPDGLSGHDIPPGSRVIAVADSIDAMMSSRSYRPAMTSAACRREIEKNSGIMYDPRVAAAALEHWDELVSRYAGADTPRTPYFDRLQLEHTRQAHDYLLTHQGSRITLPELAAKFHLSQSSLKICFKALYGVPVASYLRGLRMDTAARLLQESDLPVAEIAHRVGYEDPSRFAAAFRRHTGRRPTELRRVACPTASSHTAYDFLASLAEGAGEFFSKKIHSAHRMPFQPTPVVANRCRIMCKPYRFARWGTFYTPSQAYYSKGDLNYELGKDWSVCRRRSVWLRRY